MIIRLPISAARIERARAWIDGLSLGRVVTGLAVLMAVLATAYSFKHGYIIAYGDAESHLNIAKRVVDSLTPGFAQLGGIWLPLPHLLMIPFVYFDFLWRTGLAGSIVSGAAFVISAVFLYRLMLLLTGNKWAGLVSAVIFMSNPNILYMQSTPMTELTLIAFFILSSYYFVKYVQQPNETISLLAAALFGFCAALSRYDGWFLVTFEGIALILMHLPWRRIPRRLSEIWKGFDRERWKKLEGTFVLFGTLAFFGIILWLGWDALILGDPLYFTHSQFSAKSQQQSWLARGELPGYGHLLVSFWYYFITAMSNIGVILFVAAMVGFIYYLIDRNNRGRFYIMLVLVVPFIFNVATLFLGQSVIFIPDVTPKEFEWHLFNVRYGIMMVPLAAVCIGYLFYRSRAAAKAVLVGLFVFQLALYGIGYSRVITLADGVDGLSSATSKLPDAQRWFTEHYDNGLVLVDDYARTISIVRTGVPMKNVIYIGNKPYWPESLVAPEKYATWIIMQQNDDVWKNINEDPVVQGRLYKYFVKTYTSPEILIFRRNPEVPAGT